MKKTLFFIIILIISVNCFAQITFEKGYFIDNANTTTQCLIKNVDWNDNPTEFEYKLTENSELKMASIRNAKEFGIYNVSKFIRATVDIDKSSNFLSELSHVKEPEFVPEEFFLKTLVEGNVSLYSIGEGSLKRF